MSFHPTLTSSGGDGNAGVRIAAALLILTIDFSRVYLAVHYASDAIAGYLVAIAWLAGATVLYERIGTIKK